MDLAEGAEVVCIREVVASRLLLCEVQKAIVCSVGCGVQLRGVCARELCVFQLQTCRLGCWVTPKAVTRH